MVLTFPDVPSGQDLTISATAYVTWLRCPERALARFEGKYDKGSIATFKGIVAHRVFARHLCDGPISDDAMVQVCREEIGKGLNEAMVEIGMKPSGLAAMVEEIKVLYEKFRRIPFDGLRHVEAQLDQEPSPGLRLRGVIDAVFAEPGESETTDEAAPVRLTDWKTGSLGDASRQLAFYALLWTLAHQEVPSRLEAMSIASGERIEERPTSRSIARTADEVVTMVTQLRAAHASGERLPRIGGPWCRSCPVIDGCDEGASALAVLGR